MIPVANTMVGEEEALAVSNVVKSGWLSTGENVRKFEGEFSGYTGADESVAVCNGTAALHVVLSALGIKEGDEVILPSLTFISTANVVLYQNATPVLCECVKDTYNMCVKDVESRITQKTKAIIAVDMNGMPVDYDELLLLCNKHGLVLVADSAESLGAVYKNRKVGNIAPIHCFSFFPNKIITTGEGGMITVRDNALAKKIRILLNQGQEGRYNHTHLGYNYRMTEMQAAIGRVQLSRIDHFIQEKNRLAARYDAGLKNCKNIKIPFRPDYVSQHSWYMYTISISNYDRDELVKKLAEREIETRLSFPPVHIQPFYKKCYGFKESDLPLTMGAWKKLVNIPLWVGMSNSIQDRITDTLLNICDK